MAKKEKNKTYEEILHDELKNIMESKKIKFPVFLEALVDLVPVEKTEYLKTLKKMFFCIIFIYYKRLSMLSLTDYIVIILFYYVNY